MAFVRENRAAVERVADTVIARQELYGDELVRLLDAQGLRKPEIDWMEEQTWPQM